jgi:hypothetical protein
VDGLATEIAGEGVGREEEVVEGLGRVREGLVAYNSGLIADKLEALDGTPVGSQRGQDNDE